jgi:cholesterol transport system auxiliary component
MTQRILPLLLLFGLGGCIGGGEKPPRHLLTLSATAHPASGPVVATAPALAVLPPATPALLATDRLLVETGEGAAYLKGARWADQPARLFADLLAETIAARGDRLVVDRRSATLATAARLGGRLGAFGYDARVREVRVVYDAVLAPGGPAPVRARRFEARVAAPGEVPGQVAQALGEAANKVAAEVAAWVAE